jgi:hypothetical protein
MKVKRFIMVALLGVLLMGCLACLAVGIPKPIVSDVPQGWELSDEDPYGTYNELDGTVWGLVGYADTEDADFVKIYYGDVPSELKGNESVQGALIGRAIVESTFEPEETGIMMASGHLAGYTKIYDPDTDWYEMDIVFVADSICFDIWTRYNATPEDEAQAMSIINSITF